MPSFPALGTDCRVQLRPFQRSASGPLPVPGTKSKPTAVQARDEEQDTPVRPPLVAFAGSTGCVTIHLRLFHRSASNNCLAVPAIPTATHIRRSGHETARK
jgi:hypothetical protein